MTLLRLINSKKSQVYPSVTLAAVTAISAQKLLKNIPVILNPPSILYTKEA